MTSVFVVFLPLLLYVVVIEAEYEVPKALVELLSPRGFRVSIPDHDGITLFGFHGNINKDFKNGEAGQMFADVMRKENGRWAYTNRDVELKNGDKIYYWLYVIQNGIRYGRMFQSYKVAEQSLNWSQLSTFPPWEKSSKNEGSTTATDNDNDLTRAPPCDPSLCILPDCFCSKDGTSIPGDFSPNEVPQMITITFDGAINSNNIELYKEIFNGKRKNPNGCDIKATFFVSHKYTNYSAVQETHRKGHEIAVHSITHNDEEQFWSNATVDVWAKEMAGMRVIAEKYANLTEKSVVGVRAPYLGGNNQFTMMEEQAFLYDSTITAPLSNPPLWPYTMYFRMPHRCHGNLQHCPTKSHAVWEMVMNELDRREDPNFDKYLPGCAMVDSCSNILTSDQFYNFLNHNFDRHYDKNRAPIGLYFQAAWLKKNPEFLDAFLYWIDEVLERYNNVFFVTMTQVIQWIQNPRKISEVQKSFEPWKEKCSPEGPPACWVPHSCKLTSKEVPGETINFQTCIRCPNNYPWLNDPTGGGFSSFESN